MFANEPPREAQETNIARGIAQPPTSQGQPNPIPTPSQYDTEPSASLEKPVHESEKPAPYTDGTPSQPPYLSQSPAPSQVPLQYVSQTHAPTGQSPAQTYAGPPVMQYGDPAVQGNVASGYPAPVHGAHVRLPYIHGRPAPAAPPGYIYVIEEQISPVAILLCLLTFPFGIFFLLCIRQKYWILHPAVQQGYR